MGKYNRSKFGREYMREAQRKWVEANPERKLELDRKANRARSWRNKQFREEVLGRPQPEFCEACGTSCKTVFDHCHKTGVARGWLCMPCNVALGAAKDNPEILRKLAEYLERFVRK